MRGMPMIQRAPHKQCCICIGCSVVLIGCQHFVNPMVLQCHVFTASPSKVGVCPTPVSEYHCLDVAPHYSVECGFALIDYLMLAHTTYMYYMGNLCHQSNGSCTEQ